MACSSSSQGLSPAPGLMDSGEDAQATDSGNDTNVMGLADSGNDVQSMGLGDAGGIMPNPEAGADAPLVGVVVNPDAGTD